jgi:hypothetical protein
MSKLNAIIRTIIRRKNKPEQWAIVCSRERLAEIRADPKFERLVEIARFVNALRHGQHSVVMAFDLGTPAEVRQMSATTLYHAGILFEAMDHLPSCRPHFEHMNSWKREQGFSSFGTDDEMRSLVARGSTLAIIRNRTAFHGLTPGVVAESLKTLPLDEIVFTSGSGLTSAEMYHNLADIVAAHFAVGSPSDGRVLHQRMEEMLVHVRDLALRYMAAGDGLILGTLHEYGFTQREIRGPFSHS